MESALDAYKQAVEYMLDQSASPRAAFLGSVPYLMMSGVVLAGWQMARSALICIQKLDQAGGGSQGAGDPFYAKKLAACVMYASQILPRASAYLSSIRDGVEASRYAGRVEG